MIPGSPGTPGTPGVTNRCIHIYSRGCDVLTISLQGNLNRFISS